MAIQPKTYTAEEFWEFVNRPENQNKSFERRHGEIITVSPSNGYSSEIGFLIGHYILSYTIPRKIGHVTEGQGGYDLPNETTYAPDVAYISNERQRRLPSIGFVPATPELVVEVMSPGNSAPEMEQKVTDYLAAETLIVWVVYPNTKTVVVHTNDGTKHLTEADTLDGGDVLPGFTLPVRDIFPE
jgi:Uma2 family endonuclease